MTMKWRIALGAAVVFFAGIATGMFCCFWHVHHVVLERNSGQLAAQMRAHLKWQLNLTPAQVEAITPIVDQTASQLDAIRSDTGHRVSETLAQSHRELAPHLTPEQRAKLDRMAERRGHSFHMMHVHPPPDAP
jgi:uncharacterized protein YbaP (TraB family)